MMVKRILFVCTGNIFRSMTAEFALRRELTLHPECSAYNAITAESAGTIAKPQPISEVVQARLVERGIDPSGHARRCLSQEIVHRASLVVAMGTDHQKYLEEDFHYQAPLFMELVSGAAQPILDVNEAIPDWETNRALAASYAESVVDRICDVMPNVAWEIQKRLG